MKVKYNKEFLGTEKNQKITDMITAAGLALKSEGKIFIVGTKERGDSDWRFVWVDKLTVEEVEDILISVWEYISNGDTMDMDTEEVG